MNFQISNLFKALSHETSLLILKALIKNKSLTLKELASFVSIDKRLLKSHLDKLIKLGIVCKPARGVYEVNSKFKPILNYIINLKFDEFSTKYIVFNNDIYNVNLFMDHLSNLMKCDFKGEVIRSVMDKLDQYWDMYISAEALICLLVYFSMLYGDYNLHNEILKHLIFIDPSICKDHIRLKSHILRTLSNKYIYNIVPEYYKKHLFDKKLLFDPNSNLYSIERIIISPRGITDSVYLNFLRNLPLFESLIVINESWENVENEAILKFILSLSSTFCSNCTLYLSDIIEWLSIGQLSYITSICRKYKVNLVIKVDDILLEEPLLTHLYKDITSGTIRILLVNRNSKLVLHDGFSVNDQDVNNELLIILSSFQITDKLLSEISEDSLIELLNVFKRYAFQKTNLIMNNAILKSSELSYVDIIPSYPKCILLKELMGGDNIKEKIELIKRNMHVSLLKEFPLDIRQYNMLSKIFDNSIFPLRYKILGKEDLKLLLEIVLEGKINKVFPC